MSYKSSISLIVGLFLLVLAVLVSGPGVAQAQSPTPTNTPRPTPTNIPQPANATPHGSIRGMVYRDVNGDGQCVATGIVGETPLEGVTVQFVSSDEQTVITQLSAANGGFELAGAGESYWRVTLQPSAGWVVTSENPRYAPVYAPNLVVTDVNFCVQQGTAVVLPALIIPSSAPPLLPDSGAPANMFSFWLVVTGLAFILFGLILHWQQRRAKERA
jgi:hypothetical protein